MSLNWKWTDKMGEVDVLRKDCDPFTLNIYKGNAYAIFVYECKDGNGTDCYTVHEFWASKEHMQNCLGTSKGYNDNIQDDGSWTEIRLNTKYKHVPDIVKEIAKAKWENGFPVIKLY